MDEITPTSLINLLRSHDISIRTGILLLPAYMLGRESELAAHFGIGHQDICSTMLANTPEGRHTLGLQSRSILDAITSIIANTTIAGRCVLISNIDYLLAGIDCMERNHFWSFFRNNFRRERGIIISFPESSQNILTIDEKASWELIDRISKWTGDN